MTVVIARIIVAQDGTITGQAPYGVPPGEHPVTINLPVSPIGKPFDMEDFPSHDMGWDDSVSLRREDMYGGDGR